MGPKKEKNEIERAKETAFHFLSYRSRSSAEVKRKLEEKEFSPLTITKTLSRVKELGYLNDYDFAYTFARSSLENKAYTFARSSLENKQWGTLRIHDALLKKGVAQDIINQTLKRLTKECDLTRVARRALENKFTHKPHQHAEGKTRQKVISYLRRKGFCWDTISTAITSGDKPMS
jgi:regulatory protein